MTRRLAGSASIPIIVFILLWADLFRSLSYYWSTNPQYAFGWTVPMLSLFLFWECWITRPAPAQPAGLRRPFLIAAACLLALLPTRIVMETTPDWRFAHWALSFEVIGITLCWLYITGGKSWLGYFAFPVLFNLVAVPWPVKFEQPFIQLLTGWVSTLTVGGLNLCQIPAIKIGNIIEISSGKVGVEEACSGVRSFQATLMASLFLGQLWSFRWRPRLVLIGTGVALAFVCNVVRAWLLAYVAEKKGIPAIDEWHDPAGFTILAVSFLGLLALAMYLRPPSNRGLAASNLPPATRVPGWLAAVLVAGAISAFAGTEIWYRTGNLEQATWWRVEWPKDRPAYREPAMSDAVRAIGFDEGQHAIWKEDDGGDWTMFFFRWYPGMATSRILARWHNPEYCMPSAGFTLASQSALSRIKVGEVDLVFKVYRFEQAGVPVHVFFCIWEDKKAPGDEMFAPGEWTLRNRLDNVLQRKRKLGQQVLEIGITGIADDEKARASFEQRLPALLRPDPTVLEKLPAN